MFPRILQAAVSRPTGARAHIDSRQSALQVTVYRNHASGDNKSSPVRMRFEILRSQSENTKMILTALGLRLNLIQGPPQEALITGGRSLCSCGWVAMYI